MAKRYERYNSNIFEYLMSYKESVFRICLGFSKDPWDAEELTQEVFLKAHRKIDSLDNSNLSRGWLFKVAKNTCLDYVKKKRLRRLFQLKLNNSSVENNTPEKRIIQSEQLRALKEAINRLPKKNREVFVLKEYGHLSYEEIASTLGIKKGTVMSRINRARHAVMNQLREVDDEK
ncbi:MAG: RNA polymerase sigma factor [Candidatus Aminicenantes bacterium]|nr:MAG: RNA polymerase sigma factor [Candidatus Aminicenantes bacterium]